MSELRVVTGYIQDSAQRRLRSKSSRLVLGASPQYAPSRDYSVLEALQLDQGPTGSCGGHGTSQGLQVATARQSVALGFVASPKGIYAVTRCLERQPDASGRLPPLSDSGVMPTDILTTLGSWGVVPYAGPVTDPDGTVRASDVTVANVDDEPDLQELESGAKECVVGVSRIDETAGDALDQVFAGIDQCGAVGLGIWVDRAFQQWGPSKGPLDSVDLTPGPGAGGHWITADGYDSSGPGMIRLWNTWGASYGDRGHVEVTGNWFRRAVTDALLYRVLRVGAAS